MGVEAHFKYSFRLRLNELRESALETANQVQTLVAMILRFVAIARLRKIVAIATIEKVSATTSEV